MTETIGQKTVETRARLHNVSKTGDDSGRLQTTPGDNELYTRQRVIKQLETKVARHQPVTKTALIGFESRWGRLAWCEKTSRQRSDTSGVDSRGGQ